MSLVATTVALLAAQQVVSPRVVEVPDAGADRVVVQVWARADLTGPRERAAWKILTASLLKGTSSFNDLTLVKYGSQGGVSPRVTATEDLVKIEVWMPADSLGLAVFIATSLAVEANLRDADLDAARAGLDGPDDPWRLAMDLWRTDKSSLRNDEVVALYHRVFRPEKMVVVVGGAVQPGAGQKEVFDRFRTYRIPPVGAKPRIDVSDKPLASTGAKFAVHGLFGKPLTPSTPGGSAKLLATVAAGVGKDCSLYRVLREEKGLSYELGSVFWPTSKGWSPRLVAFRAADTDPKGLAMTAEVAAAVRDDSAKWDDATLARAKLVARLALYGQFSPSPFRLVPDRPLSDGLADRCDWEGYWTLVNGSVISRETLVRTFDNIELEDLKKAALQLVDEGSLVTVPAGVAP
ncbi:MAG: insulinase family protein [Fimbriimonadaceae bacterium]|nr:insulinase family protein [Fimbriimonadaceae bacterium]